MALLVGELVSALRLDDSGYNKGLDASEARFDRFGRKIVSEAGVTSTNAGKKLAAIDSKKAGSSVGTRFGIGLHGAIGSVVSRSVGVVTAGFAVIGAARVFGGFINDARESAKVARLSAAAIKSTGGAAHVTADQVGDLATAISNATGADDEAIQSGENLLLTFTSVRNEVGKGNDIFNQASSMITDMTAALNDGDVSAQGMKASSIQLGKALNDPIKGVGALSKVGVSFTEQQKKQIATMVKAGDTLGAQKVILAELKKEFGGAATAAADPLTRLKTIMGNLSESVGGVFLPAVDKAATWLGDNLPGAADTAIAKLTGLGKKIRTAIGPVDLSGIATGIFSDTKAWAGAVIGGLKSGVETGDWKPLGTSLGNGVIAAIQNLGDKSGAILDAVGGLIDKVNWAALGTKISTSITGLFRGIDWAALGSSLGDSVINLVDKASGLGDKLGTAFKSLINKIDWRQIGNDSTAAIISFVEGIDWPQVGKALSLAVWKSLKIDKTVYDAVIRGATNLGRGILNAIIDEMSRQRLKLVGWTKRIGGDLVSGLWSGMRGAMKGVGGFIKSVVVDPIVNWAKSLFGVHSPSTVFARIGAYLILGLKSGIASAASGIGRWVYSTVIVPVVAPFGRAGSWLVQHGRNFVAGFKAGVSAIASGIGRWMYAHIISPAVAPFGKAGTWLNSAGRNVIAGFKNGMVAIWGQVTAWVGGIATWIKDHKGPVSLDGRLLIPAGKAIMSGFLSGLKSGAGPAWNFVQSVGGKTKDALFAALGGPFMGGGGPAPTNLSGMQALVRTVAAQRGWGSGPQWDALYQLVMHESGFNPNAQNPTSSAYGLFQFLNSTWGSVGASKTSDPWAQTAAGLRYIANAYGSPANAWSKWQSRSPHWYAKGTNWVPDDQLAFVHRGEEIVPADVNRARRAAARAGSSGPLELGERSLQRLAQLLAGIAVKVDARSFDAGMSSIAIGRGY